VKYHFIGVSGVGISALAKICLEKGAKVQGSDLVLSDFSTELKKRGAKIYQGVNPSKIKGEMTLVHSTAILPDNEELQEARKRGLPILTRAECLASLLEGSDPILVTGTHGKTTVSSLLSWVLDQAKYDPSFVVGGKILQWNHNAKLGKGKYFVVEADESDGTFSKLPFKAAIVTNLEEDHIDFWKSFSSLKKAFQEFFFKGKNKLFLWNYHPELVSLSPPGFSYGLDKNADFYLHEIKLKEGFSRFSITYKENTYANLEIPMMGKANIENAAAVFSMGLLLKVPENLLRKGLKTFPGVARRMECKGSQNTLTLYDDYAHHPTEIASCLSTLKEAFYPRRVVAVYEPHRFTRFLAMKDPINESLQIADVVIATELFSAGQKAPKDWEDKLQWKGENYLPKHQLVSKLPDYLQPYDVVVLVNAGSLSYLWKNILQKAFSKVKPWKIGLLCGGKSLEHEVSLRSCSYFYETVKSTKNPYVIGKITKEGKWVLGEDASVFSVEKGEPLNKKILEKLCLCDVIIPVFHGNFGEDGQLQGFLETLQIPYVGCDYRSSAIAMHKGWAKAVVKQKGIKTAKYEQVSQRSFLKDPSRVLGSIEKTLSYPLWVKGVHLGSSIGVFRVENRQELKEAIKKVFLVDFTLIVEEELQGRLIEFAILGNEKIEVSLPGEILADGGFYSYEKKYGKKGFSTQVPADLSIDLVEKGQKLALEVYDILDCKGLARIDFFLTPEKTYYFMEINPFPGFTSISLYPSLWEKQGMGKEKLLQNLLLLAKRNSSCLI